MLSFQKEGDLAAFEELFRRHKDVLLRFLIRLSGDREVAEDASQQVWVKAIDVARQDRYTARAGVTFRTWLCTLARNHFIDEYRRKFDAARTVALPANLERVDALARGVAPDPAELAEQGEQVRRVNEALLALPFEQREVMALWAADFDFDTMAALTGAPRETLMSRRKYAIAKLRAALIREAEESPDDA
ncbi:MAG: ECF RNA polymerase sigma factor SigE [bacterium]|nr:ECF RNA polymerase sigma factor SigE [bacterium]